MGARAWDPFAVRILDVDEQLGRGLGRAEFGRARVVCLASRIVLAAGGWRPPSLVADERDGFLGFLVLSGLLSRRTVVDGETSLELLGAGDVLRPSPADIHELMSPVTHWHAHELTAVAVLDARFQHAIAPWPALTAALLARALDRTRSLGLRLALVRGRSLERRLHVLMWHMAGRWGRVTPRGLLLPLRLSHEMLGELVSARRPSVTHALHRLEEHGLLERRPGGGVLLLEDPSESCEGGASLQHRVAAQGATTRERRGLLHRV